MEVIGREPLWPAGKKVERRHERDSGKTEDGLLRAVVPGEDDGGGETRRRSVLSEWVIEADQADRRRAVDAAQRGENRPEILEVAASGLTDLLEGGDRTALGPRNCMRQIVAPRRNENPVGRGRHRLEPGAFDRGAHVLRLRAIDAQVDEVDRAL